MRPAPAGRFSLAKPVSYMDKLSNYFRTTVEEMRYNVTWPTSTELQKSAGLVLVGSIVFAIVVGVMDVTFDSLLRAFYNSFAQ